MKEKHKKTRQFKCNNELSQFEINNQHKPRKLSINLITKHIYPPEKEMYSNYRNTDSPDLILNY